jgi:ATP-dependent protease ClpP protease subunit
MSDENKTEQTENDGSKVTNRIRCIQIVGQVEGHYDLGAGQKSTKYEHILPLLFEIEQSPEVDGLMLLLNTMGGDVEAGLAIAELIASMTKPSVSLVLGGSHSIGVPLAVSAKKSFIVPSATMTIHPVRISGTVLGTPETYIHLNRMQDRITDFVTSHSRITADKFREYLFRKDELSTDTGSVLEGKEAVDCGLIDSIGGLKEALDLLRQETKAQ